MGSVSRFRGVGVPASPAVLRWLDSVRAVAAEVRSAESFRLIHFNALASEPWPVRLSAISAWDAIIALWEHRLDVLLACGPAWS